MDEWGRRESPGERIEIELTTSEPRLGRRSPRDRVPGLASGRADEPDTGSTEPAGSTDDGGGTGPTDDTQVPRRTFVLTAAGVGVAALLLGWALGRGSGAEDTAADSETATTMAVTSTTENITDTIAPPPESATTVRRNTTTTTTTLPAGTPETIELPAALVGLPYELAVVDNRGTVYRIDLTGGIQRTYPDRRAQQVAVAFRPDGSVLRYSPYGDNSQTSVLDIDGSITEIAIPADGQLAVDGKGVLWYRSWRMDQGIIAFDATGEVIHGPLDVVISMGFAADPAGGVLAVSTNGIYHLDVGAEPQRVASGDLIAIGATQLITNECDDQLRSAYFVIDRASGERTPIDLESIVTTASLPESQLDLADIAPEALTPRITSIGWGGPPMGRGATIGGDLAAIGVDYASADGMMSFFQTLFIDLADQRVASSSAGYLPPAFTPDGSWSFATNDNGTSLTAIDLTGGDRYEIEMDPGAQLSGVAIRVITAE